MSSAAGTPSTPRSSLSLEQIEAAVKGQQQTPGGLALDIVLSPAVKPSPICQTASPVPTKEEIAGKQLAAESRKAAMESLRAANISKELAKVESAKTKKEELVTEKSLKIKTEIDVKLKAGEELRAQHLAGTVEKVSSHLAKVERAAKELEVHTEAAKLSKEFALHAKMMKAEENKECIREEVVKKAKETQERLEQARTKVEDQLKPKVEELEITIKEKLEIAAKRREEQVAKVVGKGKEVESKIEDAEKRRLELEASVKAKVEAQLEKKSSEATERKARADEEFKNKLAEKEKKAELVRLNKSKIQDTPESA